MVYHVLQDGSRPPDITGHVVRVDESNSLYEIIQRINERLAEARNKETTVVRSSR